MKLINDVYKERLTNKNYKSNLEGRYKLDYLKYKFYLSEYFIDRISYYKYYYMFLINKGLTYRAIIYLADKEIYSGKFCYDRNK
jgi:hypothetical protein